MSKEVEEKAAKMVDEVEEPLRKRKKEAVKKANKAESEENLSTESIYFWSPRIIGGEKINNYNKEYVKFHLAKELPNGRDSFKIEMPDKDSVTDMSHELNRLLCLCGVDVERIADINNKRLPLVPIGKYDNPEDISYELDYPPIPTLPNRILYRTRRLALRLRLIKYRVTPNIRRNRWGDIQDIKYRPSNSIPPAMSSSAYPYFKLLNIDQSSEKFVPSELGVGIMFLMQCIIPPALLFALTGFTGFGAFITLVFLFCVCLVNEEFIRNTASRIKSYIRDKFFPRI